MYEIQTEDFYRDISKDIRKKFDTSDYSEKQSSGIKTGINRKVIGKFKDEAAGKITHLLVLEPNFTVLRLKEKVMRKNVKK